MFTHSYDSLPAERDLYKYQEIELSNKFYLVQKWCNKCHGTGIIGKACNTKTSFMNKETGKLDYKVKVPIKCRCLILAEEKDNENP